MTQVTLTQPLSTVLGESAGLYADILDRLLPELRGVEYKFQPNEDFVNLTLTAMNRVYWAEILYRCHWVAAGAVLRAKRWLEGFHISYSAKNLLATAACARGLIESSADAEYALKDVPQTLAREHQIIQTALNGDLHDRAFIDNEFEKRLIHFTHARRPQNGKALPATHVARSVAQYRADLDIVNPRLPACYSLLCDLTHPGASSVLSFAESLASDASRIRFWPDSEETHLENLRCELLNIILDVLMLGLNPALVTLKLLNRFPIEELHTRGVENMHLDGIAAWKKVMEQFIPTRSS